MTDALNALLIGLRAQDFQESLRVTVSYGPKDVKFKKTLLIGKAATLAMHLRGLLFIDSMTQLEYAAASLGISSLELPAVLHELEVVDFLSVVRKDVAVHGFMDSSEGAGRMGRVLVGGWRKS